jgi:hypothetical protein
MNTMLVIPLLVALSASPAAVKSPPELKLELTVRKGAKKDSGRGMFRVYRPGGALALNAQVFFFEGDNFRARELADPTGHVGVALFTAGGPLTAVAIEPGVGSVRAGEKEMKTGRVTLKADDKAALPVQRACDAGPFAALMAAYFAGVCPLQSPELLVLTPMETSFTPGGLQGDGAQMTLVRREPGASSPNRTLTLDYTPSGKEQRLYSFQMRITDGAAELKKSLDILTRSLGAPQVQFHHVKATDIGPYAAVTWAFPPPAGFESVQVFLDTKDVATPEAAIDLAKEWTISAKRQR